VTSSRARIDESLKDEVGSQKSTVEPCSQARLSHIVLGFGGIAGASFAIAKILAGLFLVLFLVFLILGLTAAKKIID
jgi:uncharacterized membrane protein YtjA (UPF0391 family)